MEESKTGVFKHHDAFKTRLIDEYTESELDRWYELYSQVKNASFELNSFAQPKKLFVEMLQNPDFEVMEFTLTTEEEADKAIVALQALPETPWRSALEALAHMSVQRNF